MIYVLHKDGELYRDPPLGTPLKFRQRRRTKVYVTEHIAKAQIRNRPGMTVERYFSLSEIEAAGSEIGMSFGGDGDDGQSLIDQLTGEIHE